MPTFRYAFLEGHPRANWLSITSRLAVPSPPAPPPNLLLQVIAGVAETSRGTACTAQRGAGSDIGTCDVRNLVYGS